MNVMGRRIAMTIHEVVCDIRQAADWRTEGNSPPGQMRLPRGLSQCGRPERDQTYLR